jgi:hypothetical protein
VIDLDRHLIGWFCSKRNSWPTTAQKHDVSKNVAIKSYGVREESLEAIWDPTGEQRTKPGGNRGKERHESNGGGNEEKWNRQDDAKEH